MSKEAIQLCFAAFDEALRSGNPDNVAALYAEKAVLLPTISNRVRSDYEGIRDYFEMFMKQQPSVVILEADIKVFGELAASAGIYRFDFRNGSESMVVRFSFVHHKENGKWMIQHHHSSVMPEGWDNSSMVPDSRNPIVGI